MNILFLTSSLPRYKNDGQVPFVLEQALAWKEAYPKDEIFILAPHDHQAKQEELIGDIKIFRFVYWLPLKWQKLAYPAILPNIRRNPFLIIQIPFFLFCEFFATRKILKQHNIDLIFAHWVMPQGLVSYFIKKIYKTPYGLKNYSSDVRVFHKFSFLGRFLARKVIKNAKVIFCENIRLKGEALDFFDNEAHENMKNKIIASAMGVFQTRSEHLISEIQETKYDFGFIGRLSRKKGIPFYIEALNKLQNKGRSFNAVVAGDGEEKSSLLEMSKNTNVDFIGFISDEEKIDFFNQTKVCVFPSQSVQGDVEGLPVALLEALYAGKIVIASKDTNIELLPEWEHVKNNIYLINDPSNTDELASMMEQALALDPQQISERSHNTRKTFERYKWSNLIAEYAKPLKA